MEACPVANHRFCYWGGRGAGSGENFKMNQRENKIEESVDFKKAVFWAREFRMPLFWIGDKDHKIFQKNILVLYKNSVITMFHLNGQEKIMADSGLKIFSNPRKFKDYEKKVKESLLAADKFLVDWKKVILKKSSNLELKAWFVKTIKLLTNFSDIYTRTEPAFMVKFEKLKRNGKMVKKLGRLRFDLRKKYDPFWQILIGKICGQIVRQADRRGSDLFFYTKEEMAGLFEGKAVSEKTISRRRKGFALISLTKEEKILKTGDEFRKIYRLLLSRPRKVIQIKGQAACRGKVRGRVRVILHNKKDISKDVARFRQGEILVTEMTRPDTVMVCRKAVAIITDEGSITSHAAIISRELGIPCVIGTRHATQILKTGDWVEVDANKGVVRIIK